MKRVIFDIILILSVFIMPWWVSALLALGGIFVFKQFYEFIIAGIIMYSLYAIPEGNRMSSPFWFSLSISLIYIIVQFSKRHIILYKNEI